MLQKHWQGLQRVTSRVLRHDPDKPCPREYAAKGAGHAVLL